MIDGELFSLKVQTYFTLFSLYFLEYEYYKGKFAAKIGPDEFNAVLLKYGGVEAVQEWSKIMNRLIGPNSLSEAAQATPSLALREDISAVISLSRSAYVFSNWFSS